MIIILSNKSAKPKLIARKVNIPENGQITTNDKTIEFSAGDNIENIKVFYDQGTGATKIFFIKNNVQSNVDLTDFNLQSITANAPREIIPTNDPFEELTSDGRVGRLDQADFPEEDRQAQAQQRVLGQDDDMGVPQPGDVPM